MASIPQIHQAAMNLAASLVKEELGKARPLPLHQVRQKSKPTPLTKLKALVQANSLKAQPTAPTPSAVPQVNPFTAAPTQTPQNGLLALLAQKGGPQSPNGMV